MPAGCWWIATRLRRSRGPWWPRPQTRFRDGKGAARALPRARGGLQRPGPGGLAVWRRRDRGDLPAGDRAGGRSRWASGAPSPSPATSRCCVRDRSRPPRRGLQDLHPVRQHRPGGAARGNHLAERRRGLDRRRQPARGVRLPRGAAPGDHRPRDLRPLQAQAPLPALQGRGPDRELPGAQRRGFRGSRQPRHRPVRRRSSAWRSRAARPSACWCTTRTGTSSTFPSISWTCSRSTSARTASRRR